MLASNLQVIDYMSGITQNKQKCLIFIVDPQSRKNFSQIRSE